MNLHISTWLSKYIIYSRFQIYPSIECLTSDKGFVESVTEHPRFDAIFLNFKNLSKKALYSISFECELKQDEPETIESTKYEKLHEKLGKLCLQDELSDVEIICDGKTFKCHKMILCAQSDPFKGKVHIFWEGHKILRNLHLTFDCIYCSQK